MSESKRVPSQKPLPRTIFRVMKNKDNPFVMMDKRPLENPKLSWGAKGLLSYMLSRPDDWQFNTEDLIRRSSDGEYALRGLIKELRDAGHIQFAGRIPLGGIQGTRAIWNVFEVPVRVESSRARSGSRDEHLPVELVGHVVVTSSRLSRPTNNDSTKSDDDDRKLALVSTLYESNIGAITPLMADMLRNAAIDFPETWFQPAIEIAVANNARRWNYVYAILNSWKTNGFGWKPVRSRSNGGRAVVIGDPAKVTPEELEEMRKYAREVLGS